MLSLGLTFCFLSRAGLSPGGQQAEEPCHACPSDDLAAPCRCPEGFYELQLGVSLWGRCWWGDDRDNSHQADKHNKHNNQELQ
jgi:hypothetical protein